MDDTKLEPSAELVAPEDVMGFMLWPENPFWSFQFLRLIAEAYFGGADFTECYLAARAVKAGDTEAWYDSFHALAAELEQKAERAAANGHIISARQKWLRASNYYRAAGSFHTVFDPRGVSALENRRRCFRAAASQSESAIAAVEIPYESTTLPGYLCLPPAKATQPTPAAIVLGGGDAASEEMYFRLGGPLTLREFTVLLIDGPGQGEALHRGIVNRPDWEVPVGAAVDYLLTLGSVDPRRIAVVGASMGGFYAARAAAFEPRLSALVAWGGAYDLSYGLQLPRAKDPEALTHGLKVFGAKDLEEGMAKIANYTLKGAAERIQCPTLIITGEAEMAFMHPAGSTFRPSEWYKAHPKRLFDEIGHTNKTLLIFPIGKPGANHDQADADAVAIEEICDWLQATLIVV
jgi:pimeloyl-ACP methyl ester carboxylesterase